MTEVESPLNNRLPAFVSVDPRDPERLTPNHFLLGQSAPCMPPSTLLKIPKSLDARKECLKVRTITQHFRLKVAEGIFAISHRSKKTAEIGH